MVRELAATKARVRLLEGGLSVPVSGVLRGSARQALARTVFVPLKDRPFLSFLSDRVVLEIFSDLTAIDVLSVAQVCRPVFQRVDTIFAKGTSEPVRVPRVRAACPCAAPG